MSWKAKYIFYIVIMLLVSSTASSQTAEEELIKSKIDERNNQIKILEEEIKQYNLEVLNASTQAKSLQGTLKTLDLTNKKISTDINLTQNKIIKTELTIEQLGDEIEKAEVHMDLNKQAIISALRQKWEMGNRSLFEVILAEADISDLWKDWDNINQIQETVRIKSRELAVQKVDLENKQDTFRGQKTSLVSLKQDLSGKKQAVESTTQEKVAILAITKNKEQAFKELVKTKEEQKEQFEKELYEFESQLNILIDKGAYPKPRNGIMAWPLDNVFITQKFGKTVGSEKLYTSGSHNGIDFRASTGTKVKNVLEGTVVGTGNTDAYKGCYSFGKWVMVKHDNGLSTIYGHLSVISALNGTRIEAGDTIGFSGNTGYSTGPHLHISVYATQGVRIEKYTQSKGCKEATIPLADIKAYLDPLDYLPKY